MKIKIYSQENKEINDIEVPSLLATKVKDQALALYINSIRSNLRSPIASTLNRGQVSGGGKKPWRQKGTGHARVGSSRSPLWVHGGVTFGPNNSRNFGQKINKSAKKSARQHIFNYFLSNNRIKIIDKIALKELKTKKAEEIINKIEVEGKVALFLSAKENNLARAFSNLPYLTISTSSNVDFLNLISCDWIVMTETAFNNILNKEK